jgi:hypothetical protein
VEAGESAKPVVLQAQADRVNERIDDDRQQKEDRRRQQQVRTREPTEWTDGGPRVAPAANVAPAVYLM